MSELQLGLLIISAVIVIAVLAYNKIEQMRLGRRATTTFGSTHEDVLLDAQARASSAIDEPLESAPTSTERVEHTLNAFEADTIESEPEFEAPLLQQSPMLQKPISAHPPPVAFAVPVLQSAALNSRVDFIVALGLPKSYRGSEIAAQAQNLIETGLRQPIHWEGYDDEQQAWQPLQPQHPYSLLRAGLQLANRAGPVSEDDIAAFLAGMQEMALAFSGEIETSDMDATMDTALALDDFCANHDIQIGLSVLGREGQTLLGTKIRALAESHGCVLAKDGRYHKLNEQGEMLYALSNTEPMPFHSETLKGLSTRGVALTLDVPRAPGIPATFRGYIEFARLLTQTLDGVLVDDERKAIGDVAIEQIAQQLNAIHHAMATRGIPAGSAIALRLFAG